jgi:hypothetical protein
MADACPVIVSANAGDETRVTIAAIKRGLNLEVEIASMMRSSLSDLRGDGGLLASSDSGFQHKLMSTKHPI